MESGKLVAVGSLDQLTEIAMPHRLLKIAFLKSVNLEQAQATLTTMPGVSNVRPQDGLIKADWHSLEAEFVGNDESLHAVLSDLLAQGLPIVHFSEETQNLEEVFMRATRGIVS
jgi:ABC-2 type transport system ATP-binding protein